MIEHRHLRAFVAVAEESHFGRAAERLHVSQPALSRTIRALEDGVGVALLERTTRRVVVTPAGQALLVRARSLLHGLDEAVGMARHAAAGLVGRVAVAYMDFAILGRLPALVAAFRRSHPDVAVELRYAWTERQKAQLLDGEVDVGFMIGPFHAEGVRTALVARERYVAVLAAGHRLAKARRLALADLAQEPFVFGVPEEWGPWRAAVMRLCNAAGFAPRVVEEAHSRDGIFGFVAAGIGITIHTESALGSPRRGVVIQPLDGIEERVEVVAAWRVERVSPACARFVAFLEEALSSA